MTGAHCVDGTVRDHLAHRDLLHSIQNTVSKRSAAGQTRLHGLPMHCPTSTRTDQDESVQCGLSCPGENGGVETSPTMGPGPSAEDFRKDAPLCSHRRRLSCASRWMPAWNRWQPDQGTGFRTTGRRHGSTPSAVPSVDCWVGDTHGLCRSQECPGIPADPNLNPRHCRIEVCGRFYAIALTSQVTVCGKTITMTRANPCRAMNGKAPLWMSMTFTSLGATVWR